MITRKIARTISEGLSDFAKRSKDIELKRDWHGSRDTLIITPTARNEKIIADLLDFLGDFDWGNVEDLHGAEFYKYNEIWYHSIDNRWSYDSDRMEKFENAFWFEVLLEFKGED